MNSMNDVGHGELLPNNTLVREETMPRIMQTMADNDNRKLKKLPMIIRLRKFVIAPFYDSLLAIVY